MKVIPIRIKRWAKEFMDEVECPECKGSRLKKEALYFKINEKILPIYRKWIFRN
jgi:excinuclease UvrABC ATPase subunit